MSVMGECLNSVARSGGTRETPVKPDHSRPPGSRIKPHLVSDQRVTCRPLSGHKGGLDKSEINRDL